MNRIRATQLLLAASVVMVALSAWASSASAATFGATFDGQVLGAGGMAFTQAGGHPGSMETSLVFNTQMEQTSFGELPVPIENPKNVEVALPPGFVGNVTKIPTCSTKQLNEYAPAGAGRANCPAISAVGQATVEVTVSPGAPNIYKVPVYNMERPDTVPARLGFFVPDVFENRVYVDAKVRSDSDYGVTAVVHNVSEPAPVFIVKLNLWGVPADASHDAARNQLCFTYTGTEECVGGGPSGAPLVPLFRLPTSCNGPTATKLRMNSYQHPDAYFESSFVSHLAGQPEGPVAMSGCERVPFEPKLALQPVSHQAGVPSGYGIDLEIPQDEGPNGIAQSDLRNIQVQLPQGVAISPAAAAGLEACSDKELQVGTELSAACPNGSKIGTVEVVTPLLSKPLTGSAYIGEQLSSDPQSGQMYRLFLAVEGSGVAVKLLGSVIPDPNTGQLTTRFEDNPQLPFEALHLKLFGGSSAALVNPPTCGQKTVNAELVSWSGKTVNLTSSFGIDEGCSGGGFSPGLKAGTADPTAGSYSPFTLQVTRNDGEANLSKIEATLPPGLLAKLAGVPLCGDGQAASGDCPVASQVGTTTVGAGAGPSPLYVPEAGKAPTAVYLAGPYKGAPYSLVVKVPAQAGPFDLGTVVVRNALKVDPTTTQVTAESDPLPQILDGVPLSYRDVRVQVTRPEFTLNPTNCSQFAVTSLLTSASQQTASPKARFAAANCERLAFGPSLQLAMSGATKRAGNPALSATLKAPAGQANIASTAVILPKTVFIDQRHVSNPCTRVQFNEGRCPAKSVLGTATAWSPLLDKPLEGPVYFRSNGGERQLPDIVADLNGQIHVVLVGFIDSKKAGKETSLVRTRFASVPDAPVSKFVLKLKGGKRGLIQNSANLCKAKPTAEVKMGGQNGKAHDFEQKIAVSCKRKGKKK